MTPICFLYQLFLVSPPRTRHFNHDWFLKELQRLPISNKKMSPRVVAEKGRWQVSSPNELDILVEMSGEQVWCPDNRNDPSCHRSSLFLISTHQERDHRYCSAREWPLFFSHPPKLLLYTSSRRLQTLVNRLLDLGDYDYINRRKTANWVLDFSKNKWGRWN